MVFSFPLAPPTLPNGLTPAEHDIALRLLEGLSNAKIAAARGTSTRTVANQVASLLRKLGVASKVRGGGRASPSSAILRCC
ncbi:MAG TPA: helix-turn-helix transcriptional regulator [Polyangiaceae bacterium]|nr:helix-turn-helix transcriptional regulator [Polyangiaceae bacterium]